MRLEHSILIARPVDEVFALIGNPDNDTRWGTLIAESRQISPGPVSAGTAFEQTATFLGARLTATITVTDYEAGKRVCYEATQPVEIQHCRTLEDTPEGTLLTFETSVEMLGAFRLPESFLRQIGRRQMEADMDDIKTLLEAEQNL